MKVSRREVPPSLAGPSSCLRPAAVLMSPRVPVAKSRTAPLYDAALA